MIDTMSLRMRLTLIILGPLLCIALIISLWAFGDAQRRASDRFDRSLLSAVLAISGDVAVSGGDALSPETSALLQDTSGGPMFYHVYAPDGVFVTGYATRPAPRDAGQAQQQTYFDAIYQGRKVRALRFEDAMQIEGLSGTFTFTVWQDVTLRNAIVRDLSLRTFRVMASLVLALALIVWFGVRLGLRPLLDLQDAIARRTSDELTPIKRAVPTETRGIVHTLNALLAQVSSTLKAKDDFISNAAHQLRNPIAGVLSMAEAVNSARRFEDMKERSAELVVAAQRTSSLANKLLALERAKATAPGQGLKATELHILLTNIGADMQNTCDARGVTLSVEPLAVIVQADALMLREAVINIIDNAMQHGGDHLSQITITTRKTGGTVDLCIRDDGRGMAEKDVENAMERFSQISPTSGSGLGLAIAKAAAERHEATLHLAPQNDGLSCCIKGLRIAAAMP